MSGVDSGCSINRIVASCNTAAALLVNSKCKFAEVYLCDKHHNTAVSVNWLTTVFCTVQAMYTVQGANVYTRHTIHAKRFMFPFNMMR